MSGWDPPDLPSTDIPPDMERKIRIFLDAGDWTWNIAIGGGNVFDLRTSESVDYHTIEAMSDDECRARAARQPRP